MSEQLQFPFPSLDFPGRSSLPVKEIAEKLGITNQHILDLVEDGVFTGLDLKGRDSAKRCLRIPIEVYRDFIVSRMTGPYRAQLIRQLPKATLRDLRKEIDAALVAA
jgi:hypothetical protein